MKKLIILLSLILLTGCSETAIIKTGKISCEQKNIVLEDNNAVIIDVRTKEEYKEFHMDNAINIPYEKIIDTLETKNEINKETPIIVYCKSGTRSNKAYISLINAGYKNVYDLGAISKCNV